MKLLFQIILVTGFLFSWTSLFSQPVIIDVTTTPANCNGSATGTITFSVTGGAKPYYYYIIKGGVPQSSPQTSDTVYTFTNVSAGIYLCIVEDNNSLNDFKNRTVSQPSPISVTSVNITPITCTGYKDGKIDITASGESGSYNFLLKPVGLSTITGSFNNLDPGTYRVIVSDATGCLSKDSTDLLVLSDPDPISITDEKSSNLSCHGVNDGTINITASGGTGAYTFTITPGGTSNHTGTFGNLAADTYTVEVTDVNSCPSSTSNPLTISQPDLLQYTAQNSANTSCFGVNDGTITLSASGGTPPYLFTLSPGGATNTDGSFTGLAPGTYTVNLTDSKSCGPVTSNSFNINQPSVIAITGTSFSHITCHDFDNGEIHVTASGGNAPLTYTLNPGALAQANGDFTSLAEDTYTVTVTDTKGCPPAVTGNIIITNPLEISVDSQKVTQISCNGAKNGAITIYASGGTGTLHFTLSPGAIINTTGVFSGLEPNDYTITVTDDNSCPQQTAGPITISQPDPLQYTAQNSTNTSCFGVNDGTITLSASGGTPPYLFTLSPGGTTNTDGSFTGLAPGTYTVNLTDARSCGPVTSNSFNIDQPSVIAITGTSFSHITCNDFDNGEIHITASGGNAPLTYTLNPGALAQANGDFTSLAEDTYTVTVTDTKGCAPAVTGNIIITNPPEISVDSQKVTQISCNGAKDGVITLYASGGTGTLHFTLNPGAIINTTGVFSGLEPNDYTITVTDDNSCPQQTAGPITISQPDPLSASVDPASNLGVSCFGNNNGSININVTGGTAPYNYSWSGPAGFTSASQDITNLSPGDYNLTLSDSNSCSSVYTPLATVTEPPQLQISLTKTDVVCNGAGNGTITVIASGGTPPYKYSRNGITYQNSNIFTGLSKNTYTIYVRDNNLCLTSGIITINEPDKLLVTSEIRIDGNLCYGDSLGEIRILAVSGGITPYQYSIDGGISYSSSPTFNFLPAGSYQTVVKDNNGCTAFGNLNNISQPSRIRIDSYVQTDVTGCSYSLNGQIAIEASGGTGTISYRLDGGSVNTTGIFTSVGGGNHTVSITDINNCLVDTIVYLNHPSPLIFTSFIITNVTGCPGETNGAVSTVAGGGTGTILYSIDGGIFGISGDFTGLSAGPHILTIKDDNNCTKDSVFNITEPDPVSINSVNKTDISCAGDIDGTITVVASGGTTPYTYTLEPVMISNNDGNFTGLGKGKYMISVNDLEGCGPVKSDSISINEPDLLVVDSVTWTEISCAGDANGNIQMYVSGGTPTYSYSIDNGVNFFSTPGFNDLGPGTYNPVIRDFSNCEITSPAIILIDPDPFTLITESSTDVTDCFGNLNGSLIYEVTGGTGEIQYSIDDINWQTTGIFTGLGGGNYTVIAKDSMNCTRNSSELLINQPDQITADITSTPYLNESHKGTISITNVTGGTGSYEYSVNGIAGPFTTQTDYADLIAGTYEVVIKDANNCTYIQSVDISTVPPLDVTVTFTSSTCNGSNDAKIIMTVNNPMDVLSYSIDDSASWYDTYEFSGLGPGTYYIGVKEESGRYFADTITLYDPLPLDILNTVTPATCNLHSPDAAIAISVTGGTGTITYQWADGPAIKDRSNLDPGTYTLTVTDENGCDTTEMITVPATTTVIANAGADTTVCHGSIITLNGLGGTIVSWAPAEGLSNPNISNPTALINAEVIYTLTVVGNNDCYDNDTITIGVYPKSELFAGYDTTVIKNNPVNLNATGDLFESYQWDPSTGLDDPAIPDPVATLQASQLYILTAVDGNGCVEKDTISITVIDKIIIYNSFSPNDDGINDYWDIDNAEYYPDIIVEVFNRWGEKLFSSRGYTAEKRWDGYYKGKKVPIGTYYYVVIPYDGANAKTGPLTIIR